MPQAEFRYRLLFSCNCQIFNFVIMRVWWK